MALKLCSGIISDAGARDPQKMDAFEIMIDVLRRGGRGREALSAAERMRTYFPAAPKPLREEAEARSLFAQFYCYRDSIRDLPLALNVLRELVRRPEKGRTYARAQVEIANVLLRMRRYAEAYHEAEHVASLEIDDDRLMAGALWQMMEAAWRNGRPGKCAAALKRLLEPRYLRHRKTREHVGYHLRYAECLERLGERTDRHGKMSGRERARKYLRKIEEDTLSDRPTVSQELALRIARSYLDDGRYAEALSAYERVFTEHAGVSKYWYDAQRGIVEAYLGKGSPEEALLAARICLDVGSRGIGRNARLVAEIMRELDGDVKRANAFLDYQRYGPAGEDGKTGTADDLKDPLRLIVAQSKGYPSCPERERTFAEVREKGGDGGGASLHRALTYTYTGHPEEALAYYVDAFRRSTDGGFQNTAEHMILVGLRAVRGHAAGLERVCHFVAHGPTGPDGEAGTEDDMQDSIEDVIARRVPAADQDVEALRQIREFLVEVAGDRRNPRGERQDALWGLQRVNEALGGRCRKGRDWYVELVLKEGDDRTQEALVGAGQSAAKGGEYHLGGVHAFWRELASRLKEKGKRLGSRAENRRRGFHRTVDRLSKSVRLAPRERHLKPGGERREKLKRSERAPLPEPGRPDLTPPRAPTGLKARSVSYRWAQITWQAAGVAAYRVFRDGELVATLKEASFTDKGLAEGVRYVYAVQAVNDIGMESRLSSGVALTTLVDRERPKVESVQAAGDAEKVVLVFSEEVQEASAENPANYHISQGVRVKSASLGEDARSVTLGTSTLSPELDYALRMRNVKDRAKTPNACDPAREFAFEYVETGDGLSAVYYDELDFKGKTVKRIDKRIKFAWSRTDPAGGIKNTDFSVRWTGSLRPDHSETYTFCARTDDGVRLWVGGKLIVDAWLHRAAADSNGRIDLRAGVMYDIKMEFFQGRGDVSAELYWSSKSVKKQIIPQANLYSHRSRQRGSAAPATPR